MATRDHHAPLARAAHAQEIRPWIVQADLLRDAAEQEANQLAAILAEVLRRQQALPMRPSPRSHGTALWLVPDDPQQDAYRDEERTR